MEATSMVLGKEGTSLQGKLVTVDNKGFCRLYNIDTGEQIKEINAKYKEMNIVQLRP